jgi:hypothetical protein
MLLDVINTFAGKYKIIIQKAVTVLYTNNARAEKEIRKNYPIHSSLKQNKIPRNKPN